MQHNNNWWPQAFGAESSVGCGGVYKTEPEDFVVEEIPAYEPCGEGEHLYLWVQKRKLSTPALLEHVARVAGMKARDMGCAGMKDTFAVTRQMISLPAANLSDPALVSTDHITVLRHARHGNKLRTGHLKGNRFTVVLRAAPPASGVESGMEPAAPAPAEVLAQARAIAMQVEKTGVPNFFGEQRFGRAGETVTMGLQILRGERPAQLRGPNAGRLRRLALNAVQSALFNQYLNARVQDGSWQRVLDGEVLQVCASGGPFVTDDVAREQARFAAQEVVPAGPIFGPKMRAARGDTLAREEALLKDSGCDVSAFASQGKLMLGTRRPLVVWPKDMHVDAHPHGLQLSFTLPAGAYATVVLREFCRC